MKNLLEFLLAKVGLALIDCMSISSSQKLAQRLADMWFFLNISRRRVTEDNIRRSGIADSPEEIKRIAKESFRNFALLVIESLKSNDLFDETTWKEHVEVDIPDETMQLLEKPGQGVILLSGHFGNWEIAAQLLSYIKPVVGITKNMNNPLTNKLMQKRKPRNRFRLTPKRDTDAVRFISALKNGEILALLADQYAIGKAGMMVDFFGTPASTHTSPAMLHLVTGTPICFGYCIRTGKGSFKLAADKPLVVKRSGDKQSDIKTILENINQRLESAIREHPEQYLWAHRRWRHI